MPRIRPFFAVLSVIIAPALAAQTTADTAKSPVQVAPLNVTAERTPASAADVAATVRVLDRAELTRRATNDLPTVLRDVPGIQADPVVGSGMGLMLQGLGSDRVLILLDGSPLTGRIDGQLDLTRVNPALLDRVEVVEGPQSTLYGSDALGGVVNLITRHDFSRRAEFSTQGGTNGQMDERARVSGGLGSIFASVDAGHRWADLVPGGLAKAGGTAERWDGMGQMTVPMANGSVDVRLFAVDEDQRYGAQGASGPENDGDANRQVDGLAAFKFGDGATELRLHASDYTHTFTSSAGPANTDQDHQTLGDVEALRRGQIGEGNWLLGVKVERDALTSDRIDGGAKDGWTGAAFGSTELVLGGPVRLGGGIRFTDSDIWGSNVAPSASLVVHGPAGFDVKVGGARGFRVPSFKEQYFDFTNAEFGYSVKGDPDLKPESSWNLTAEIGRSTGPRQLYVRGYENWIRNLIETALVDSATFTFQYQNVDRALTRGAEVGGALTMGPVIGRASFAWLHAEDETTGQPLDGRAAKTGRVSLTAGPGPLSVTAEMIGTSAVTYSEPDGSTITQAGYDRANLSAGLTLGQTRVSLGADNIFNTIPANATMFLGRRWYAGLTWGFGW